MAILSALDASTVENIRSRIEGIEGVQRVLVDPDRSEVWIVGRPDAASVALEAGARDVLGRMRIDADALSILVVRPAAGAERQRVRFAGIERRVEEDGQVRVRVALEWEDEIFHGEELGGLGLTLEIRAAAAAAVHAVALVTGGDVGLRLTGIKQVRAFDQEIMVASMARTGGASQHLVGAVLTGSDPLRAAVMAVLNALNRVLGNYLSTPT